jgi:hypothetical protein
MTDPGRLLTSLPSNPSSRSTAAPARCGRWRWSNERRSDPAGACARDCRRRRFNPYCRDKSFYKFLFAGVVMFARLHDAVQRRPPRAGYQTMSGGFYTLIAAGMIWSWWGRSPTTARAGLKWLLFAAIPLIAQRHEPGRVSTRPTPRRWPPRAAGCTTARWLKYSGSWKELFGDMGSALAKSSGSRDARRGLLAPVRPRPVLRAPRRAARGARLHRRHRRWRQEEQGRQEGQADGRLPSASAGERPA